MMDMDWLKGLIKLVEESEIDFLEVEGMDPEAGAPTRVRIRKSPRTMVAPAPHPAAVVAPAGGPETGRAVASGAVAGGSGDDGAADGLFEVTSPMVGTFYRAPAPDADAFVSVGDHVEVGQTLCILEAMKLMNELQSDVSGIVREISVENAEPVEFGALLFRIEPN